MQIDRELFKDQGFLILRNLLTREDIEQLRTCYDLILERQKRLWSLQRHPEHPPGGEWESSAQPRMILSTPGLVDPETTVAVDVWLDQRLLGVANQLLAAPEAAVTELFLMCSPPVKDFGPSNWHRDLNAVEMAPLQYLIDDFIDNGPRYVQWNIPLHDDSVLWVVPGSHRRLDLPHERPHRQGAMRSTLAGAVAVDLRAGDAVIYSNYILHWGSNYSTKLRRTLHGGHSIFTSHSRAPFLNQLSTPSQRTFQQWNQRTIRQETLTEMALRSVMARDAVGYAHCLEALQFGISDRGKLLLSIYLAKVTKGLVLQKFEAEHSHLKHQLTLLHPISLKWGPDFHQRFTADDVRCLEERFHYLQANLVCAPDDVMSDQGYHYEQVPGGLQLQDFLSSFSQSQLASMA